MDRRFRLLILVPWVALVSPPASADGVVTRITHQIRVAWDAAPHPARYDVVRGNVANLAIAGSTVDLGLVACLADDLARLDTSLAPDAAGPGSCGQGSGGRERVAGSEGCLP